MNEGEPDDLDGHLAAAFAIEDRPADPVFIGQVEVRMAEIERFRRWRKNFIIRTATQGAALGAIGGAAAWMARAPDLLQDSAPQPGLIWPAMLVMLASWLVLAGRQTFSFKTRGIASLRSALV